jgi:hypothetical protein
VLGQVTFRFSLLLLAVWVLPAHADLYRWVDPETGTVKFSSYPPPWYGNEELQKRRPKVEHIPERSKPGSFGAPADPVAEPARDAGPDLNALEGQRRAILRQLGDSAGPPGAGAKQQLESLAALMEQLDKLNPEGAAARRAEAEALLQKLIKGKQP